MGSLAVWRWSEGTVSVNTTTTPKAETFDRVTILFSQTLGTALGDWVAGTNDLGYGGAQSCSPGRSSAFSCFMPPHRRRV